MTISYLEYELVDGFIHNWAVAGPFTTSLPAVESSNAEEITSRVRQFYTPDSQVSTLPVDQETIEIDGSPLTWRYTRCAIDHYIDVSAFYPNWTYAKTLAFTILKAPSTGKVNFILNTFGPADIWLNQTHLLRNEALAGSTLQNVPFEAELVEGENQILVRFEAAGVRNCPHAMALRLIQLPAQWADKAPAVRVPSLAFYPSRQRTLEALFEKAYLEQVVNYHGNFINLHWAEDTDERLHYAYQIMDERNRIYIDGSWQMDPSEPLDIGHPARLFERPLRVVLKAPAREYWDQKLHYQRDLPIHVLDNSYSAAPYSDFFQRNREALEDAARREEDLFGLIAKFQLEAKDIKPDPVLKAIERVNRREASSDVDLLGLLGMLYRYADKPSFLESLKKPLQECVLGYRYTADEPGGTAVDETAESHSLILAACEVLAGQLYANRRFTNTSKTGRWHRQKGEKLALEWISKRGKEGFADWDSNTSVELNLAALSHLTSLAKDESLSELAAILMDKIFFGLAVNSFEGVFGSTQGCASADMLKSAQLESTSGITRMMWGMGVFNHHTTGTVSLACSGYQFPMLLADIATDLARVVWNRERHTAGTEVNKVTYRTADYMLSSAQDYHPGQPGKCEHIWQASLGPEAVVFVNHPASLSQSDARLPGFWAGNAVLPRVAQWKDVLIAVHQLPEGDWMGFTHAYFPTYAFDERVLGRGWAFARKGNGYLAITASKGMELVLRAPDGYRELRSNGSPNTWLVQMGQAASDGSFDQFQQKVLGLELAWQEAGVKFKSLRGEELSFGWEGAFLVDGNPQPLAGYKHFENPYCVSDLQAGQMDITRNGLTMRLTFD